MADGTAELHAAVVAGADDLAVDDQRRPDGDATLRAAPASLLLGDLHELVVARWITRGHRRKDAICNVLKEAALHDFGKRAGGMEAARLSVQEVK